MSTLTLCITIFILALCHTASGIDNCYHKVFVHNSADDNLVFGTGLLLEVPVSHRAECVSLCQLHEECNVILYHLSSSMCRLQNYQHIVQSGAGVPTSGWSNYALQCQEPPDSPSCVVPDVSSLLMCSPCLQDDSTWRNDDFCSIFNAQYSNNGGVSNKIPLAFELAAGMNVIALGSIYSNSELVGVCLENQVVGSAHLGVFFKLSPLYCDVYDENQNIRCDNVLPTITPSSLTFNYVITESVAKLHVDGTFMKEFPTVVKRDRLDVYGFSDVEYVLIIQAPEPCILP